MNAPVEQRETAAVAPAGRPLAAGRSLVLVAGSGRSGTSLFTGIMQRLGYHVPQPEVAADPTNPRGFAEPKWVVDFHTELLERAGVQMADARPGAWADTARVALDGSVRRKLREWLAQELRTAEHLIVKDPRLSWFLPLWRQCGEDLGVPPRFVTVLRHPAAVIDSKQRAYGSWQGDVERTAGWVNQVLYTERATRDDPRAFVRYQELLEDWTGTVARVGDRLDLAVVRDAPAASIVQVHEFVDRTLNRSREGWGDSDIPAALRELADEVWELSGRLAEDGADGDDLVQSLEAARKAYIELYEDAEAIAQSSIAAAGRGRRQSSMGRMVDRVPSRYKRRIPRRWRVTVNRALARSGRNA
jgi:hypothetical protein